MSQVGAGPVGSVLALTLLKNGIPVRIIDKAGPQIGQKGAGIQVGTVDFRVIPSLKISGDTSLAPLKCITS